MAVTNFTDVSAANTAVARTFAAVPNIKRRLTSIAVSWSGAAPTTGSLTVTDNGVTILSLDLPLTLNTPFVYPCNIYSSASNQALVITVAAGGVAGAVSKLNTTVSDEVSN
jgi:hypothetical protein